MIGTIDYAKHYHPYGVMIKVMIKSEEAKYYEFMFSSFKEIASK